MQRMVILVVAVLVVLGPAGVKAAGHAPTMNPDNLTVRETVRDSAAKII